MPCVVLLIVQGVLSDPLYKMVGENTRNVEDHFLKLRMRITDGHAHPVGFFGSVHPGESDLSFVHLIKNTDHIRYSLLFIEVVEGGRFDFVAAFNRYYLITGLVAPDYTDGLFLVH